MATPAEQRQRLDEMPGWNGVQNTMVVDGFDYEWLCSLAGRYIAQLEDDEQSRRPSGINCKGCGNQLVFSCREIGSGFCHPCAHKRFIGCLNACKYALGLPEYIERSQHYKYGASARQAIDEIMQAISSAVQKGESA